MLTDFARDHAFTIAWFGLMTMVWFGWGQEDPPQTWRWRLGAGSVVGVALAGAFGYGVVERWNDGSAMEGRYGWFGVLVALELIVAGVGCVYLWRKERSRWMAWWVAVVVAAHFPPLALILNDDSLVVLGLGQAALLAALVPRLRSDRAPTSRLVGPVMGGSFLVFAAVSLAVFLGSVGTPW